MIRHPVSSARIGVVVLCLSAVPAIASPQANRPASAPSTKKSQTAPVASPGSPTIAQLQAQTERDPNNPKLHIALGLA